MVNKILRIVSWIVCALVLVSVVMILAVDISKIPRWSKSGVVETEFSIPNPNDTLLIFTYVNPADFPSGVTPRFTDTLITIYDKPISLMSFSKIYRVDVPPGTRIPVTFTHKGTLTRTELVPRPRENWKLFAIILINFFQGLLGLGFTFVAIWAFYKRTASESVRVLMLFCLAMAMYIITGFQFLPEQFATIAIPFPIVIQLLGLILITYLETFWLHLQLVFPHKHPFLKSRPALKYIALYSLQTIAMMLIRFQTQQNFRFIQIFIQLVFMVQIGSGLWILWRNYKTSAPGLERRQLKLVLLGSVIGLIPLALYLLLITVSQVSFIFLSPMTRVILSNITFAVLLVTPAMYAYAMGRYRLLDIEGKLRRGTRYLIVTGLLSLAVFLTVYFISGLLLSYANITDRAPTLLIAILFTLGITPTQQRIQLWLERKYYPERMYLREMFAEFLQKLVMIPDRESLWQELRDRLREGLYVDFVVPVLQKAETEGYRDKPTGSAPFSKESQFIQLLELEKRPVLIDELIGSKRIEMLPGEQEWLREKQIALVIPLVVQTRLVGFVGLGFKTDQQDFTPHDMTILSSLGAQIAMAHENLRLREESIEKKRLEEQLSIARRIQMGFLPQVIPATDGLTSATKSVFCVEVAGDYYDIFSLPDNQTVLAVGDVVGKGAGAAMLMANLQASFHTAIDVNEPLEEIVRRINHHIFRNTDPEQFITFFTGIFDPKNKEFRFINAGHNPPLLVKTDGTSVELTDGGLLLGCFPNPEYQLGRQQLESGDWIILYTDGVTEAMNRSENEFGMPRLLEVVENNRTETPAKMVDAIYRSVVDFHGSESFEDDLTLLVVKVR